MQSNCYELCPMCGFEMRNNSRREKTRDHIIPKEWSRRLIVIDGVSPIKIICKQCNLRRAMCGHCIGAMHCIEAVRQPGSTRPSSSGFLKVFRQWKMGKIAASIQKP